MDSFAAMVMTLASNINSPLRRLLARKLRCPMKEDMGMVDVSEEA